MKVKRDADGTPLMPPPVAKKPKVQDYGDDDIDTDVQFSQLHGM